MKALAAGVLGLVACLQAGAGVAARPLRVATLNTVLTEIAREVGGRDAEVEGLVAPGVDPHTFNPSPADIRTLVDADIVLASGLNIEGYLGRLAQSVGPGGRLVAVGDALPSVMTFPGAGGRREPDPHWWQSIGNMVLAVDLVRVEFARARPPLASAFSERAAAYSARLEELEAWARDEMAKVPPGRRHLVTSHDAFRYFARDYGLTIHAIGGVSTEAEADARNVAALIELIRRERIRTVFAESSVDPRLVENLVRETGASLGGTLYADGLGPEGSGAESYASMYRHNVRAIVDGLRGP